jgi:hypothetical protein
MTPEQLKGMVFPGESGGDYDALFGFSNRAGGQFAGVRPTQMTINQVLAFTDPSGPYGQWVKGQVGRVATPVGGFQVVGSTLRDTVKRMGLTGDEMFSPAVQDAIGMNIYQNQGPGAWEGWGKGGGGGGSGSASSGSNSGGGTMPMGLFDMQEQPPQTFGERLRAGMRSGSLIDSLALAANSLRDRPDQNIAQIVQGRQERREGERATNRTAAWLASQGRDDLAQAMLAGGLDAKTAVATAMAPAPQAEVREVGGKLVSVNPDGTVNELYAPATQADPQSAIAKLEADRKAGLISQEQYDLAAAGLAPSGISVEVGPDGQTRIVQGAGAGGAKPFTEGQGKDVVFSTKAKGALETFEPVADSLTSATQRAAGYDPTGIIRGAVQTPEFQVAQNSGNEFLQAILRKETGAAITQDEQILYGQVYLPQPGDGPDVLAAKKGARQRAVAAIDAGMSPEQMVAQEKALGWVNGGATPQGGGVTRKRFNPETGAFE